MTGVPRVPLGESAGRAADAREVLRLRRATQEFESLLLAQMLKSIRRATDSWDTGQSFPGRAVWKELLDEQLALAVARGGGLGLARFLERALLARRPR